MHFTALTLAPLFAAALSAPTDRAPHTDQLTRATTFAQFAIWSKSGCQPGDRTGTISLTNATACQSLPAGIVSGRVENNIPVGCSSKCLL
jgi:hypothetical protein